MHVVKTFIKVSAVAVSALSLNAASPLKAEVHEQYTSCAPKTAPTVSSKIDGRHVVLGAVNGTGTVKPVRYKVTWTAGSRGETVYAGATDRGDATDVVAAWASMAGSQIGSRIVMTYSAQAEYRCAGGRTSMGPIAQGSRVLEPVAAPIISSLSQSSTGEIVLRLKNTPESGFIHVTSGCCVVAVFPTSGTVSLAKPKSRVRLSFETYAVTAVGSSLNSNSVSIVTR